MTTVRARRSSFVVRRPSLTIGVCTPRISSVSIQRKWSRHVAGTMPSHPSFLHLSFFSSPLSTYLPLHGNRPCRLPIPLGPPVQQDVRLWPVNRIVHPPPTLLHPQRPGERTKRVARVSGSVGSRERTWAEIATHRHSVSDISLPFGTWRNERANERTSERANERTSERVSDRVWACRASSTVPTFFVISGGNTTWRYSYTSS